MLYSLKAIAKNTLSVIARNSLISQFAQHIVNADPNKNDSYAYLKRRFIENARSHSVDRRMRGKIVERFERINRDVPIASTPTDGLFLAEMVLNTKAKGALVECGSFAGGSSAKLSILAKLLDRPLYVCDSFEGLPQVDSYNLTDFNCRRASDCMTDWSEGRYAARLDLVKSNIEKYGEMSHCNFVKGWFSEILESDKLPASLGFAFTDVDIASSARECFVALWPRLAEEGVYAIHDTAFIKVLQELYDPDLWVNRFKDAPPILFGAGFGLCNDSPHLGYMVKGKNLTPQYLKGLTLDK